MYHFLSIIGLLILSAATAFAQTSDSLSLYIWHDGSAMQRPVYSVDSITVLPKSGREADLTVACADLGLSVAWGVCNLGALAPEGYGNYYAWGETLPKAMFTARNYKWGDMNNPKKYNTADHKTVLDSGDDAASVTLGTGWHTPTREEWQELSERCQWEWTSRNGVSGFKVTAANGNSIFLPAAGYCYGDQVNDAGHIGSYWTSSLIAEGGDVKVFDFADGQRLWSDYFYRHGGQSIRPVHVNFQQ